MQIGCEIFCRYLTSEVCKISVVVKKKLTVCAAFFLLHFLNEGWAHFLQHLRVQLKRNITLILHVLVYYEFFGIFINSGLYRRADPRQNRHRPKSKFQELAEDLLVFLQPLNSFKTLDTLPSIFNLTM